MEGFKNTGAIYLFLLRSPNPLKLYFFNAVLCHSPIDANFGTKLISYTGFKVVNHNSVTEIQGATTCEKISPFNES